MAASPAPTGRRSASDTRKATIFGAPAAPFVDTARAHLAPTAE